MERAPDAPIWRAGPGGNRAHPAIVAAVVASLVAVLAISPLAHLLQFAPLSLARWGLAALVSLAATALAEGLKSRWRA